MEPIILLWSPSFGQRVCRDKMLQEKESFQIFISPAFPSSHRQCFPAGSGYRWGRWQEVGGRWEQQLLQCRPWCAPSPKTRETDACPAVLESFQGPAAAGRWCPGTQVPSLGRVKKIMFWVQKLGCIISQFNLYIWIVVESGYVLHSM